MPPSISYPLVKGHRFSYASIELKINGSPFPILGVKSINYSQELAPGDVWGTAPHKIGRTRGKNDAKADMEMLRLEWDQLRATLGAGGVGYGEMAFDIMVTYSEKFSPVVTDKIIGARITNAEFSNSEGTDASMVKLTMNVIRIIEGDVGTIVASLRA